MVLKAVVIAYSAYTFHCCCMYHYLTAGIGFVKQGMQKCKLRKIQLRFGLDDTMSYWGSGTSVCFRPQLLLC